MSETDVVKGDVEDSVDDLLSKEKSYMFEERLDMAGRLRQVGNERFKRCHMKEAAEAYEREKHRQELSTAKLPILLNLCQCLAKTGAGRADNAARAVDFAKQAIELDASCAKAWFWRGKAKMDGGDLEGSAADLEEAAKLAPGDKSVRIALKVLRMKEKELATARRSLWGGMFKGGEDKANPPPGRKQVEEAAARARGEDVDGGVAGDDDRRNRREEKVGWGFMLMAGVVGIAAFALAGVAAGRYTQGAL